MSKKEKNLVRIHKLSVSFLRGCLESAESGKQIFFFQGEVLLFLKCRSKFLLVSVRFWYIKSSVAVGSVVKFRPENIQKTEEVQSHFEALVR